MVRGFHIQVRDMSVSDNLYDVVTISGGGTRSHTLSDLRPATDYTLFVLPYNGDIMGTPSNLKVVTTKEDGKTRKKSLTINALTAPHFLLFRWHIFPSFSFSQNSSQNFFHLSPNQFSYIFQSQPVLPKMWQCNFSTLPQLCFYGAHLIDVTLMATSKATKSS